MTDWEQTEQIYHKEVRERISNAILDCPKVLLPVMEHLQKSEGKQIRAMLMVETAKALDGVSDEVLHLAAATEILHLATLVHDDVIDDAGSRRGLPSVQMQFGKKLAVISGDYLFTRCFRMVAAHNKDQMEGFSKAVAAICIGEALQQQNCGNVRMDRREYFRIIGRKTAALFAMAMHGAATTCKACERTSYRLALAGFCIGMVFQMIDDCLDYESASATAGKSIYKDLEQGVMTFPLIHAISKSPDKRALFLKERTGSDVCEIVQTVKQYGGITAAREAAQEYCHRAKRNIRLVLCEEDARGLLVFIDAMYNRKK